MVRTVLQVFLPLGLLILLFLPRSLLATAVTVNVASNLNDVSAQKLGINTDYWMDDPAMRAGGARPLSTALVDIGAKFLRYPGGEKSDGYLWSIPPFTNSRPRLARVSSSDWPANDSTYWTPAGDTNGNWSRSVLDFDEFMSICVAAGAEPIIVVAYDGIYKTPYSGSLSLTYAQAMTTAVEWVRYANVVKGYNVKYWTIGNETWSPGYMGGNPGYAQYGLDASAFARAMKAVDPSIKVGINGNSTAMFDGVLANCKEDVDFLDVHGYPAWTFVDYSSYRTNGISFKSNVDVAQASINKLAEPYKSKLFIVNTEASAATYGYSGNWTQADTGHGLVDAELFLCCLNDSRLKFSLFWNTRWVSDNGPGSEHNALDSTNGLTANGLVLKVLNTNLLMKMVYTTASWPVYSSASYDPANGNLSIYLVNRDTVAAPTAVTLQNYTACSTARKWVFKGSSSTDLNPTYAQGADVNVVSNTINVSLDPVSVTVIKLAVPRRITTGTLLQWVGGRTFCGNQRSEFVRCGRWWMILFDEWSVLV